MGAARKFFMLESVFDFSHKGGSLKDILYGNTCSVFDAFWVSVSKFWFFLVGLMGLFPNLARVHSDKETSLIVCGRENPSGSSCYTEQNSDGFDVKEKDFHVKKDYVDKEDESFYFSEDPLVSSSRSYEFISNNTITGFIEEPKAVSFTVHQLYLGSDETEEPAVEEETREYLLEEETEFFSVHQNPQDSTENFIIEKKLEKSEDSTESYIVEKKLEKSEHLVTEHVTEEMLVYEIVSCVAFKEGSAHENCVDGEEVLKTTEEDVLGDTTSSSDDDEFIELKPEVKNNSAFVAEEDFIQREIEGSDFSPEEFGSMEEQQAKMSFEGVEGEEYNGDDDDDDDMDDELEYNDVIERLKMELRSARTGGLATILEESETPLEELKPLKIDAKFELKDRIAEIQKVYKSYSVKMRKLDVLNSQTTHSISLLKLKGSTQLNRDGGDSSVRASKSLLRQNLWPFKKHQFERDPMERLIKGLGRDFETVYVGQLCLSWEILHWQYVKVLEFHQHDPDGICQYNLVAGEFQLFQVLVQRFVENEPFQSCPRAENYLKSRRRFHNFLQVPSVRDDRSSRTNKCRNEGEFAITIEALREIIQESMRVFWEFIRADKDEFCSDLKVSHQTQVSPQEPLDLELLTDIRTDLQKKQKRLKEILRRETCIVKKLKKNESTRSVRVKDKLLIAQVELRLVSRVMKMSKLTTDQLFWCQEKLNKVNFNGRKVQLEPSFSFFPC